MRTFIPPDPHFLDTSYLLALEIAGDINHAPAVTHWRSVREQIGIITTTYIFDETITFFNSRGLHSKAVQVGNLLLNSPSVEMVTVQEDLFQAGWLYFQTHQDKRYSLTDCISFVLMQERGIYKALTLDKHFAQAGFINLPT